MPNLLIPTVQPQFAKESEIKNSLFKVLPASRGNRVGARRGSPRFARGT
jgi:hypothetical protein